MGMGGPQGPRARRPSILDGPIAPPDFSNAQVATNDVIARAPPAARGRARTNSSAAQMAHLANGVNGDGDAAEVQNARAIEVLDRVQQKLTGRDFKPDEELTVVDQVNKLIVEATNLENLCQHYIGWCSFW
jgi:serine/threonine-protein kinase mTOR